MTRLIACLFGVLIASSAVALEGGAAVRSIVPPDLNIICLAGYDSGRPATGIHDTVAARAWYLRDDNGLEVCLVAVDIVGYMSPRIRDMKSFLSNVGLAPGNLIICSTHSHSAGDGVGLWGAGCNFGGVNSTYLNLVDQAIMDAVLAARRDLQPISLKFTTSTAPGFTKDVRTPEIIDEDVILMQAIADDNSTVFTFTNHGIHPTILGRSNRLLSGDIVHFINERIEATYGGTSIWAPNSQGAIYATNDTGSSFQIAEDEGYRFVDQFVVPALATAPTVDGIVFQNSTERVDFVIENPLFLTLAQLGVFEFGYQNLADNNFALTTDVSYWEFQDDAGSPIASFATAPGELFPEVGLKIRNNMAGSERFLINLANNQLGYIIEWSDFDFPQNVGNPGRNYHETTSAGRDLEPKLLTSLFRQMGAATPTPVPTETPTPGPTDTPTPTATPRPQQPQVLLGGYMQSDLTETGGTVEFLLFVTNPELIDDVRLGDASLSQLASNQYGIPRQMVAATLAPGSFLIDATIEWNGQNELAWPYLVVE